MKVLVTGTPGTGKTSIAKQLSKLMKIRYVDVKRIIDENKQVISKKLVDGTLEINEKLKKVLAKKMPKDYVIDTHLVEYAPNPDIVIILRTEPSILKKRLTRRGYSYQKIMENLEVEIIDYFTQYYAGKKKVIEYDTSRDSAKQNAEKIMKKIKKQGWNKGKIKWDQEKYFELLK